MRIDDGGFLAAGYPSLFWLLPRASIRLQHTLGIWLCATAWQREIAGPIRRQNSQEFGKRNFNACTLYSITSARPTFSKTVTNSGKTISESQNPYTLNSGKVATPIWSGTGICN
jgi:hypothetical protein